jgi:hypothetical protein
MILGVRDELPSNHVSFLSPNRVVPESQSHRSIKCQIFSMNCGEQSRLFLDTVVLTDLLSAERCGVLPEVVRTTSHRMNGLRGWYDSQEARQ